MTSNPQARRQNPVEINGHPLTPSIISYINHQIHLHELRVAIISSLIGIPILSYLLIQIHSIKSHLRV